MQSIEDALGHLDDRLRVGRVLEEHGELVTTETGRCVTGSQAAAQAVGHRPQELVARSVPEAVVDELEVVEVDEGHRGDRRVAAADASQGVLDAVEEQRRGSTGR